MNKKLLKGALVLFASIFMAVSCSNNNTDPGKPSVSKSDVETFLKRLDSDASLTAKDSTLADGNTFAVTLSATTQTKTVDDIKKVLSDTLTAANNIQAVTANDIADNRLAVDSDEKAVTYTITLKPKSGYNIGSFGTVKVVVAAGSSNKWKKIEVTKANVQDAIKEALGTTVDTFSTANAVAAGSGQKITITITDSSYNGASKFDTVKPIVENKYDNVKIVLADLGITTEDTSLAVAGKSSDSLTATLGNCTLSALYSVSGVDSLTAVNTIEIKLTASGGNWS